MDPTIQVARPSALVVGGSGRAGGAIARELGRTGYDVVLTWCRHEDAAKRVAAEVRAFGARAVPIRTALTRGGGGIERLAVDATDAFGPIDAAVFCAATGSLRPLSDDRAVARGIGHAAESFTLLATALADLRSAVALSSIWTTRVTPGYGALGVAQAALETVVRYLAVELAPRARVNAVAAGAFESPSVHALAGEAAAGALDAICSNTPAGHLVTPEQVASVVAFLASERSDGITGQTVVVDGGYSLVAAGLPSHARTSERV